MMRRADQVRLSVVICTRDRRESVARVAASLQNQTAAVADLEVIVVDNGSADDTRGAIESMSGELKYAVKVVLESETGLSAARNAGLAAAAGESVAYLDDDAYPVPRWAEALLEALEPPMIGGVGGRTVLAWPSAPPSWLAGQYHGLYGSFDKGESALMLSGSVYPVGANMAFSAAALRSIGGFNRRFGRAASSLLSNEEVLVFRQLAANGYSVAYAPEALAIHHVQPGRVRVRWVIERAHAQGMSDVVLEDVLRGRPFGLARDLGRAIFRGKRTLIRSYSESGIASAAVTQAIQLSYAVGRVRQRSCAVEPV
jgi:glycosyltransferase involved in cell wall biosynthesis